MKTAVFLFVSQVTASALPVRTTRECWQIYQHLMDRQALPVLIPPVVSVQSGDAQLYSLPVANSCTHFVLYTVVTHLFSQFHPNETYL